MNLENFRNIEGAETSSQQPSLEVPKPPEQRLDQLEPEKISEKNKKIIQDFDIETKTKEEQEKRIEEQVSKLEKTKQTNLGLNVAPSSNEGIDRDIGELQEQRAELAADLEKRKPNETEQIISGEIAKIDEKIRNIKTAESQDLPGMVPPQIIEGRKKDVESLEKERNKMLEELDIIKLEKIKKYYTEAETTEQKPVEEIKENKETQEQKKENAWDVLKDEKVMERKPDEVAEAFKEATGEDLSEKREKMVEENLEARHMTIVRGKNAVERYRQQLIEKEQKRILIEEHSRAVSALWERNPNIKTEDREKYLAKIKKSLGLEGAGGNIAFDKLINDGYEVEKAKTGWFSNKLKIPKIGSKLVTIGSKGEFLQDAVQQSTSETFSEAQIRADLKIIEGRKLLLTERQACTKTIIEQAVENHNLAKQKKQEAEQQAQIEKQKKAQEEAGTKQIKKEKEKEKPKRPEKREESAKRSGKKKRR